MNPTVQLNRVGQSLWLDNITRDLLDRGILRRYIDELSVTGLTSNPTIYDKAIGGTAAYDADVQAGSARGTSAEEIFFSLALDDLGRAADLFAPIHARTGGVDGYVSLEVSPLLAHDAAATHAEAVRLHGLGGRPNLFIKIPGTPEGLGAIEETIFAGVPVNVTLLFSSAQYRGCLEAYTRGIERRVEAGKPAFVGSVASVFISRWDSAVADGVPADLRNRLGIAIGMAGVRGVSEVLLVRPLAAPPQRGCPPPAAALREHRHKGPGSLGRPLHRGAGRAAHGEHDARGYPPRVR